MKRTRAAICLLVLLYAAAATAQTVGAPTTRPELTTPGPTLGPITGVARTPTGEPRTGQVALRLTL